MPTEKRKKLVVPSPQLGSPPFEETERFPPKLFPAPAEDLAANLRKYARLALDIGAADAKVVPARDIPQDTRAHYIFCHFPRCRWMNSSLMCPTIRQRVDWDDAVEALQCYNYAVAYKILPPSDEIVAEAAEKVGRLNLDMYYTMGGGPPPDKNKLLRDIVRLRIAAEMLRKVEQAAFYDGYMFAMSLGVGPCMVTWCSDTRKCRGLEKGGFCPIVNSRPTGNAEFYVDYHALARKLGWGELQPRGNCAMLEEVSDTQGYYNIGLTLIQ